MWNIIWSWLLSHWTQVMEGVTQTKVVADTIDSIKKLAPRKLESKETTQRYLEQTVAILDDKDKTLEAKQWEVSARQSLVESMVDLTAIDAKYTTVNYAIFTAATLLSLHILTRFLAGMRRNRTEK